MSNLFFTKKREKLTAPDASLGLKEFNLFAYLTHINTHST